MKTIQESEILNYLQTKQYATVKELSQHIYLSPSSVRRKLDILQKKNLVIRTHGGVKIVDTNNFFPSFTFRSHQNSFEKKKIAIAGAKFIKDGDVIFLDGSTSAFFMAEVLSEFKNLTVITNGIDTISALSKLNVNACSTGGYVSKTNGSVLIGNNAIETIEKYHADVVFFSAQSIRDDGEIFDCFEEENYLRKAMLNNSNKKIFLCDSTKFGKSSPYKLCSIKDIDYLITDKNIDKYFTTNFNEKIIKP